MTDIVTESLRTEAANDRHLAKVERLLGREGVSPAVLGRVAALVDAPVGADDATLAAAVQGLRKDVPGLFATTDLSAGTAAKTPRERAAEVAKERGWDTTPQS